MPKWLLKLIMLKSNDALGSLQVPKLVGCSIGQYDRFGVEVLSGGETG